MIDVVQLLMNVDYKQLRVQMCIGAVTNVYSEHKCN
jgi:hypothetical protein